MGKFITLATEDILPSQDFLKPETINHILDCFKKNDLAALPPTPIVCIANDKYVAIDGHNLIAVYDFLNKPCGVYVADSENDNLPEEGNMAIQARNKDLHEKYNNTTPAGLTFSQLRQKYPAIADTAQLP